MAEVPRTHLRIVRDPEPLASYIRPQRNDFRQLAELVASNFPAPSGIVIDGRYPDRAHDLLEAAAKRRVGRILDPLSVEFASPVGMARPTFADLPWVPRTSFSADPWTTEEVRFLCEGLAEAAVSSHFDAVLAPVSWLPSVTEAAIRRDVNMAIQLRQALDRSNGQNVLIYYPLVARLRALSDHNTRAILLAAIRDAIAATAVDAIWLRIPGFDAASAGAVNLQQYVDLCRSMHTLGVPIIGERLGTLGLAMLSFGAISGVESGITIGERYDPTSWFRQNKESKPFAMPPRVYLPSIGLFLKSKDAQSFFAHGSVRNWFACQKPCCPRGAADMIEQPRRHFVVSRTNEVADLVTIPTELRASHYMDTWLRLAGDRATRAARVDKKLLAHRDRLDRWRVGMSTILERDIRERPTIAKAPVWSRLRKGA